MPETTVNSPDFIRLQEAMEAIPVDQTMFDGDFVPPKYETTLRQPVVVSGPSTYNRGKTRTLECLPSQEPGWYFDRTDLPDQLPIPVTADRVCNTRRNITLQCGFPENRVRMTEHIIALRLGLGIDNLLIRTSSDDPPLFDVGEQPLVEALLAAGIVEDTSSPLAYWTVAEPQVLLNDGKSSFLAFYPDDAKTGKLTLDVAIDFPNAIGRQRIQFDVTPAAFRHGAQARTNCTRLQKWLLTWLGWLSKDTRHFGYTWKNILVAGKNTYTNEPNLIHNGKSLEAAWHRACLDLLAALSLTDSGRLCGRIVSYRAGHALDCQFMTLLKQKHALTRVDI